MGSAFLYLAIVVIWGIVLVPMWLRREGERSGGHLAVEYEEDVREPVAAPPSAQPSAPPAPPARRAEPVARPADRSMVLVRRRRRTLILGLITVASAAVVVTGLAPWWMMLPSLVLVTGHLTMLRVAVRMDAEQRRAEFAARLRAAHHERETAEARAAEEAQAAVHAAKVIDLMERNRTREVFDQFTDASLRAVGD